MAVNFSVPKSPTRSVKEIDNFLGVDLTNSGSNISEMRSPNAPNMIRDVPGKVRKRTGYSVEKDFCEDEIVDDVSYKRIPLLYSRAYPYEISCDVSTKYVLFDKFVDVQIPIGQKYAVKIKYSNSSVPVYLRTSRTYSEDKYFDGYLPVTNGEIVTKTFFVDPHAEGYTEGAVDIRFTTNYTSAFSLTLYDICVVLVSNNTNFKDFDFPTETLTKKVDDLYSHSGVPISLVNTTIDLSTHTTLPISRTGITDGLKRLEVKIKANFSDSYSYSLCVRTSKDAEGKDTVDTVYTHYISPSDYSQGVTIPIYIDASCLTDYLDITQISVANTATVQITICDADYIDYATYKPVNDVPVFGAHSIKGEDASVGKAIYNKNRFVYDFKTKGISATLNKDSNSKLYYLQDTFRKNEKIALCIDYTSTENVWLRLYKSTSSVWKELPKGTNKTYKTTLTVSEAFYAFQFQGKVDNTSLIVTSFFISHVASDELVPNSEIKYSLAPEQEGDTFDANNMYNVSGDKTALISSTSMIMSGSETAGVVKSSCMASSEIPGNLLYNKVIKMSLDFVLNSCSNYSSIKALVAKITMTKNGYYREIPFYSNRGQSITVGTKYHLEGYINYDDTEYTPSNSTIKVEIYAEEYTAKTTGTDSMNSTISNVTIQEAIEKEKFLVTDEKTLIHVGKDLYLKKGINYTKVYTNMNKARSKSWQLEKNVFIVDGKQFLVYDDINENVTAVYNSSKAYIPTLTIAKPTKNGTSSNATNYESINLLNTAFKERFTSYGDTATSTVCQMSRAPLTTTTVKAWVMDSNGNMIEKTEGTNFSVNRSTGTITFNYKIGEPPLTGEDNIIIQAYREPDGYKDRINSCTIGALFGVNGASDRLFLSGNPKYINYDWYSGYYDFTYFPDDGYAKLGLDSSAIVGYSIINNYLAAHKDQNEPTQGVIIREGDLVDNKPAFKIINTLQGEGAIAPYSFAYLETEPLFLTRSGIFAVTASDVTGEKYSQNRSFYLNGQLTQEIGLDEAYAIVYNDMYWLFINNNVYILDGLQATQTDRGEPYATRQYVGFLLNNIPANVAWENNGALWFGTTDGKVCKFYTNKEALESYNDDGKPIEAWWETPDLDGSLFYKNKTFRYIAIRLKSNVKTGAKLYSQVRGLWTLFKNCRNVSNIIFKFSEVCFSDFTFNHDTSDVVVSSKLRVKKIDKARFKIENCELNEPFGIQNVALEYVESGNFKG